VKKFGYFLLKYLDQETQIGELGLKDLNQVTRKGDNHPETTDF